MRVKEKQLSKIVSTLVLATGVLGLAGGGAARAAEPTFTETASVVAVEIPVQVNVDGEPVRNLTAANFEVTDNRKRQEITGFTVVDLQAAPAATPAAAAEGVALRRHFLMLFDLSFSEPAAVVRARAAARELVTEQLHPTDLVGVAVYVASKGAQLLLGFTSDRRQIELALDTLGTPELIDRNPDPLGVMLASLDSDLGSRSGNTTSTEARAAIDEAVLENIRDFAQMSAKSERENQGARVTAMTRSFADLARMMNAVRGRKYVVYLSQGFDAKLLTGDAEAASSQETRSAAESGEIWNVDSDQMFGSSKVQNDLEQMLEEFRRADCVIQAVDIGGLAAGNDQRARPSGKDALFTMAKDTGGEFYQNFNNLGAAMGSMLRRTSVTYVLTIQPTDLPADGKYRKLSVKLKNAPKGARVVHRPGYYAPKPFRERAPVEKQLQAAELVMGGVEGGSVGARVLAAPFQQAGERAYVPVLIEVPGAELLAGHQGDVLPAEIYAYALDEQGNIRGYVAQSVGLDLKKVGAQLRASGIKFFGHIDLAPGEYALRVLVRNANTGNYGLQVLPLSVPAKTAAAPYLLPPFFPEAPGKWLMMRETLKPGEAQAAYPFMLKQDPYIPAVRAEIPSGGEARVALVGYRLGAGELKLESHVFGADGSRVEAGTLRLVERAPADSAGIERLLASFNPAGLAPGQYDLKIAVTGAGGRAEAASVPITVVRAGTASSR